MNTQTTRRTRSVQLTLGLFAAGVALTAPASVAFAGGDGSGSPDLGAARNDVGSGPDPAAGVDVRRMLNDIDTPLGAVPDAQPVSTPVPGADAVTGDDSAWDAGQLALGAALGAVVTAAGALAITKRRDLHPA